MGSSFSTSTVFRGVDRMSPVFDKMSKRSSRFGDTLKAVLSANIITAGFNRIVGGVQEGIAAFSNFEMAMAKVSTIADTNTLSMGEQSKAIIKLSNVTGKAVAELAEAEYQAISAGIDTANAVDFVGVSVKAAIGGFTDTTTAVDGLTTILNAYSLEAAQAAAVSDQLIATQNFGKTTFGDMAQYLGQVVPIASALKLETFELFGSIAALTKVGIKTPQAMTGIKAALSNILKPAEKASKMADQLGLDFSAAALESKGLAGFLQDITDKTGGSQEKMADLFGSVEALNTVMALTAGDGKNLTAALDAVKNSTGSTEAAFDKMSNTMGFRWQAVKNRFMNVSIGMADSLSPLLDMMLDIVEKVDFDALNAQLSGFIGGLNLESMANSMIEFIDKAIVKIPEIVSEMGLMAPQIKDFVRDIGEIAGYVAMLVTEMAKVTSGPIFSFLKWSAENNIISQQRKAESHFEGGGSLEDWLSGEAPNQAEADSQSVNVQNTFTGTGFPEIYAETSVNGSSPIKTQELVP